MLAIIALILVLLWVFGLGFHIGGSLVHIVLVVAVIAFLLHLVQGRRRG